MHPLKSANPITVTKGVFGLAGAAAGLAVTVAREVVHAQIAVARGALHLAGSAASLAGAVARETAHALRTDQGDAHEADSAGPGDTDEADATGPTSTAAAESSHNEAAGVPPGPTVVAVEPHAPDEPPVDVVGQALAAEAAAERGEGPDGAGVAHEPRAASRDEEHGDAALQRAEVDEIAEEALAALEGDVEPEEHLTEPLLDSADAKAVAAELRTMSKAADPDKG